MANTENYAIEKVLSFNDTGETGTHQAGILIPKRKEILSFFPALDKNIKNPRQVLMFFDKQCAYWSFNFIYYNNKFFDGTRNEYRLTGMTNYLRANQLKAGDTVTLLRENGIYKIRFTKLERPKNEDSIVSNFGVLKLSCNWKTVKI